MQNFFENKSTENMVLTRNLGALDTEYLPKFFKYIIETYNIIYLSSGSTLIPMSCCYVLWKVAGGHPTGSDFAIHMGDLGSVPGSGFSTSCSGHLESLYLKK